MSKTITTRFTEAQVESIIEISFVDHVYNIGFSEGKAEGFKEGRTLITYPWIGFALLGWVALFLLIALLVLL